MKKKKFKLTWKSGFTLIVEGKDLLNACMESGHKPSLFKDFTWEEIKY